MKQHSKDDKQTMYEKIVQLNEKVIQGKIKKLVRGSVEETLNELLGEGSRTADVGCPLRARQGPSGLPRRPLRPYLTTTSGDVTLHVPGFKGVSFEVVIIKKYHRRESGVDVALIKMYLAGVPVRRAKDITEALWGSKMSPAIINGLNEKAWVHIEEWRIRHTGELNREINDIEVEIDAIMETI